MPSDSPSSFRLRSSNADERGSDLLRLQDLNPLLLLIVKCFELFEVARLEGRVGYQEIGGPLCLRRHGLSLLSSPTSP